MEMGLSNNFDIMTNEDMMLVDGGGVVDVVVGGCSGAVVGLGAGAAVGSAVDNEADTGQLAMPITIPLMLGLFIMLHTFQHPSSGLSFWASIIPFTSPMVMLARLPFGVVPGWQLALSIALLLLTFVFVTYLSARIYRVGILMYGKKASFKDLYKWMKSKK